MARRGDNIHKRKDGRWEGRYRIGTTSSGKTKYASVYGKTYGEVKSKLTHSIEASSCNHITQKNSHALRFTDILLLWIRNNNLKHKAATELKYLYLIENHIIPGLGRFPITEINSILINNFLEEKSKKGRLNGQGGLSASYIKTMAFIIKSAISFAVKEDYCQPLKSEIFIPPKYKKDLSILSKENQNLLETALIVDIDYTKLGILIALHSGIRIGEVCALTWSNIDLDNQVLHINHTVSRVKASENSNKKTSLIIDSPKTISSKRDIPIPSTLIPHLTAMYQGSSGKYVITNTYSFISPRTLEYRYQQILNKCGITKINFHALRHTFATRCIESGVDVKSLSEILGHANVNITLDTYVHPSMDMKRFQIEKLSQNNTAIMV